MVPWIIVTLLTAGVLAATVVALRRGDATGSATGVTMRALIDARRGGRRDGKKDLPSALTLEPFPTPVMRGIYAWSDARRASREALYRGRTKSTRVRIGVIRSEAERAAKRDVHTDLPMVEHVREWSRIETDLDAARAALEVADEEHAKQLERIDADTVRLLQLYWGENLAARPRRRGEADARLFGLQPPSPAEWRDQTP